MVAGQNNGQDARWVNLMSSEPVAQHWASTLRAYTERPGAFPSPQVIPSTAAVALSCFLLPFLVLLFFYLSLLPRLNHQIVTSQTSLHRNLLVDSPTCGMSLPIHLAVAAMDRITKHYNIFASSLLKTCASLAWLSIFHRQVWSKV